MKKETWKDVKGYEGIYIVSNLGNVIRLELRYTDKNGVSYCKEEKKMIGGYTKDGYHRIGLTKDGERRKYLTHRIVADAFLPNPENKEQINHKNGIKNDNKVENLEWCTRSENMKHAYDELGFKREEYLKDWQVLYIRENYKRGKGKEMCKKFGVCLNTIMTIIRGETYKRVK